MSHISWALIEQDLCVYFYLTVYCVTSKTRASSWWYACVFTGVSGEASLVRAREGDSAELSCSLTPTSKEGTTPNLFPLHVVEWVRLGFSVPILIKFGVYAPRVHPNYKGKSYSDVFNQTLLSNHWLYVIFYWRSTPLKLTLIWSNLFFSNALAIWLHTDGFWALKTLLG